MNEKRALSAGGECSFVQFLYFLRGRGRQFKAYKRLTRVCTLFQLDNPPVFRNRLSQPSKCLVFEGHLIKRVASDLIISLCLNIIPFIQKEFNSVKCCEFDLIALADRFFQRLRIAFSSVCGSFLESSKRCV